MGFFWKPTTSAAALTGCAAHDSPFNHASNSFRHGHKGSFPDYPFLDRMSIVFVGLLVIM